MSIAKVRQALVLYLGENARPSDVLEVLEALHDAIQAGCDRSAMAPGWVAALTTVDVAAERLKKKFESGNI